MGFILATIAIIIMNNAQIPSKTMYFFEDKRIMHKTYLYKQRHKDCDVWVIH